MTINYNPQPGRGLVISGPQASGKTRMAKDIADQRGGPIVRIEFGQGFEPRLKNALHEQPKTLIIDGDPSVNELVHIKHLLTLKSLVMRGWHTNVRIPTLLIIICTQNKHRWLAENNRRFDVIDLI